MMDGFTDEPTFAPVLNTAINDSTMGAPGASDFDEFSTNGSPLATLNAQTAAPVGTTDPTDSPTQSPTSSPSTFSPTANPTFRPTWSPTYYPTSSPTYYPTSSPTFSDTDLIPGPTNNSAFFTPTLDAQIKPTNAHDDCVNQTNGALGNFTEVSGDFVVTNAPSVTDVPIGEDDTAAPTSMPSSNPTTETPTLQETDAPSVGPSMFPTSSPTRWPTMPPALIINAATSGPSGNNALNTTNVTESCMSSDGNFFIARERNGNETTYNNILSFAYELETAGRTQISEILPTLEAACVDSILHVLFPSECDTMQYMRLLHVETIVGVRSTPTDQVIEGTIVTVEPVLMHVVLMHVCRYITSLCVIDCLCRRGMRLQVRG